MITLLQAVQIAIQVLMMANLLSMAGQFSDSSMASRAAERLHAGYKSVRWGAGLILMGIVVFAQADAVRYLSRLPLDDPTFESVVLFGQLLSVFGMATINGVLVGKAATRAKAPT